MQLRELIRKNRSYRRFFEDVRMTKEELLELVDLARLSPSAKNLQHFKYYLVWEKQLCDKIFPLTAWAGYLPDWQGPEPGERPAAYITVLHDMDISNNKWTDQGIPTQSILLGATEKGYGGCIIAAVRKDALHKLFNLPPHLQIIYTIALGKPKEIVQLDEMINDDHHYWRDEKQVHHVPKRKLEDIVLF